MFPLERRFHFRNCENVVRTPQGYELGYRCGNKFVFVYPQHKPSPEYQSLLNGGAVPMWQYYLGPNHCVAAGGIIDAKHCGIPLEIFDRQTPIDKAVQQANKVFTSVDLWNRELAHRFKKEDPGIIRQLLATLSQHRQLTDDEINAVLATPSVGIEVLRIFSPAFCRQSDYLGIFFDIHAIPPASLGHYMVDIPLIA